MSPLFGLSKSIKSLVRISSVACAFGFSRTACAFSMISVQCLMGEPEFGAAASKSEPPGCGSLSKVPELLSVVSKVGDFPEESKKKQNKCEIDCLIYFILKLPCSRVLAVSAALLTAVLPQALLSLSTCIRNFISP